MPGMDQESGRKRQLAWLRVLWAGLFVAVAAGAIVWVWFSTRTEGFKVDGLPFREWIARNPDFNSQMRRDLVAKLGTNVVPHLVGLLRQQPESPRDFQSRLDRWNRLPWILQGRQPLPDWQVRRTALMGLEFLGREAGAALPDILALARIETNLMVRGVALVAALNVAPQAPETFELWRAEWEQTNHFARRDLALYLQMPRVPVPAAVPYLLAEVTSLRSRPVQPAVLEPVVEALGFCGEAARPAIPEIVKLFEAGGNLHDVLLAFQRLGPVASEAVPALAARLREESAERLVLGKPTGDRVAAGGQAALVVDILRALQAIGPEAKPALPAITPLLTNSDLNLRLVAAAAQVRVGGPVQEAIPILLAGLESESHGMGKAGLMWGARQEATPGMMLGGTEAAAILCGELGRTAVEALPALERRLQDRSSWMRIAAAQAIWRISRDPKRSLPTLVAVLDSTEAPEYSARGLRQRPSTYYADRQGTDRELVHALEAMEEMGPAAKAAVPSIERVRTFSVAARHAANRALRALNGTDQRDAQTGK